MRPGILWLVTALAFLSVGMNGLLFSGCSDRPVRVTGPSNGQAREGGRSGRSPHRPYTGSGAKAFYKALSALKKKPSPDFRSAARFFERAAEKGGFAAAYHNLALCWVHLGDLKRARSALRKGLEKNQTNARLSIALAGVEKRMGNYKLARKILGAVVRKRPGLKVARNLLTQVLLRLKRFTAALTQIQKVLAADPSNAAAYTNFGLLYLEKGDPKTALMIYAKGLKLKPSDPDLLTNKAVAYLRLKRFGRAVESLEKAVRLDPKHVASRLNLGKVYLDNLDYRGALNLYRAVLTRWPVHLEALLGRARALFGLKKFNKALKAYKDTLKIHAGEPRALYQIGLICQNHLEKPRQALLFYKRFVARSPALPKGHRVFTVIKALEAELGATRSRPRRARPPARTAGGKKP